MRSRNRHQRQHQHAIAEIAQEIPEPETDRQQAPERRIAPALRVRLVARAADRETRKHRAGENVEPVEIDHLRRPSLRSSSNSRVPWIRKAQIALGMAQTESWKGVSWMPKSASAP